MTGRQSMQGDKRLLPPIARPLGYSFSVAPNLFQERLKAKRKKICQQQQQESRIKNPIWRITIRTTRVFVKPLDHKR